MDKTTETQSKEDLESILWTPGDPKTIWGPNGGEIKCGKMGNLILLPSLVNFQDLDMETIRRESYLQSRILRDLMSKIPSRIDIDGGIGDGKSTLTSLLYQITNARPHYEITDSPQLELFSHDAKTYGIPFQLFLMRFRFNEVFNKIKKLKEQTKEKRGKSAISDKAEAAEKAFWRVLMHYGLMEPRQFTALNKRLNSYVREAGHADLTLLLKAAPMIGYNRTMGRGRDYEVSKLYKLLSEEEREAIMEVRENYLQLVKEDFPEFYEECKKMFDEVGVPFKLKQGNVTPEYSGDLRTIGYKEFKKDLARAGQKDDAKEDDFEGCSNGAFGEIDVNNFTGDQGQLLAIANMVKYGLIANHVRKGYQIEEDRKNAKVRVYSS